MSGEGTFGRGIARVLALPAVERIERALATRPPAVIALEEEARRAAVALILRPGEGDALELLMIKRAAYEGDPWSGHVALPGGRQEPDESVEDTAIRETREETAIDLAREARLLGRLDDLEPRSVRLPRLVIAPFVFAYAGDPMVTPSPEVAEAFWVPVTALRDPAASREIVLELTGGPRRVPSFQHGEYTIWGLTERILRQFLELWRE
ncbi:MAG TPA: CoA pyrophosphatase [Gemmatimonadaceae bacterium]|nr:CoA pyrophosphatase [Gemmatimonadaceae bacterium]